ncbi:hypothetical protein RYX36_013651 [Vicia faba]
MAYYNQNPPPVNVNVSAPPPVGYQGYPPPPQPQIFVTQTAPQNSAAAETAWLGWPVAAAWRRHVGCAVFEID